MSAASADAGGAPGLGLSRANSLIRRRVTAGASRASSAATTRTAEIAARLLVSDDTVKTHVSRVPGKLRQRDWTQAAVTAYETGLVVPHSG